MAYKQHFIEWFSGKSLPNYWYTQVGSGGTGTMADSIDGGYQFNTTTTSGSFSALSFHPNRFIAPNGSVMNMVLKANSASNTGCSMGLSDTKGSRSWWCGFHGDSSAGNYTPNVYWTFGTAGNATVTYTASTVALDTIRHHHQLETKSASCDYSIDGSLQNTRTSNIPSACPTGLMPHHEVYHDGSTTAMRFNLIFEEIYNT